MKPDVKTVLGRVRKVEVKTKKLVDGLIAGHWTSVFRGRGIEFREVREYVPGDDIRAIDWNVTARYNTPYVKEFTEERDLNVYVVYDVSASAEFGSVRAKSDVAIDIAASIMLGAMRNNDNVGLCLFTDSVERFYRCRKGRKNALRLIREALYAEPKGKGTDVGAALKFLAKTLRRRSVVIVISDFLCPPFERQLRSLRLRHDVLLIPLIDRREQEFPDIGYVLVEDAETGEQVLLDTSDPQVRQGLAAKDAERRAVLQRMTRPLGIGLVPVMTDEPFEMPLRRFFGVK